MNTIFKTLFTPLIVLTLFSGCQSESPDNADTLSFDEPVIELDNYTPDALTDEQKYALAYMWHEEKLAYDIYLELNKVNPAQQLSNIATKSEIQHISLVEDLVEWYDINVTNLADYTIHYSEEELKAMPTGIFAIDKIQKLYDDLYAIGAPSKQKSLEVGCMVEVVDVDDLDEFIEASHGYDAIVDTFTILRDGSYSHYWAFHDGLIKMGVAEGCCSLGDDFCKPEYPQK